MKKRRNRRQEGSVFLDPRTKIWSFRYRDASGKRKAERIGNMKQFPTKSKAKDAAEPFRLRINSPEAESGITLEKVAQRYVLERMPSRHSTSRGYRGKLKIVLSKWGARTLIYETPYNPREVHDMATYHYPPQNKGAAISSGSFVTSGMVVAPCSMRTLAAIANGQGDHLIHRAADVILKERRKLVLVVREMPLSDIHLENMLKLSRMGVVILPPVPAFYNRPHSIDEMVDHIVMRILDQFDVHLGLTERWDGAMSSRANPV